MSIFPIKKRGTAVECVRKIVDRGTHIQTILFNHEKNEREKILSPGCEGILSR
jgi:hypothetical protein